MSKDLWFENMEREVARLEGLGLSFDQAYGQAAHNAFDLTRDQLADRADAARQRRKDGEL